MPAPSLRTRVRVQFPDGTLFEVDRDPSVEVGGLIAPSSVGAFWTARRKLLVKAKEVTPASDLDPGELRYVVDVLGGSGTEAPCTEPLGA